MEGHDFHRFYFENGTIKNNNHGGVKIEGLFLNAKESLGQVIPTTLWTGVWTGMSLIIGSEPQSFTQIWSLMWSFSKLWLSHWKGYQHLKDPLSIVHKHYKYFSRKFSWKFAGINYVLCRIWMILTLECWQHLMIIFCGLKQLIFTIEINRIVHFSEGIGESYFGEKA